MIVSLSLSLSFSNFSLFLLSLSRLFLFLFVVVVCEVSLKVVMNGGGVCGQDLNRVKDKPYTAAVEDDERPDHVSNLCLCVCVCMHACMCAHV